MFTGIEHFAIASPNPKRLAEWYVSYLEFEISFEYAGNYFIEAKNGSLIEIIPAEGERPESGMRTPGMRHIAISVDDFDAGYEQLKMQGVKFEGEPYTNDGNRLVFFKDPDGNLIHLIKREHAFAVDSSLRPGDMLQRALLAKRVFRAFQYPDFRLMWLGACTSSIGTWMQILAQSWLVYQLSNSSVYLGLDAFFGQIPIFLFSLFGGVFADRKSRRTLLLDVPSHTNDLRLHPGRSGGNRGRAGLAHLVSFVHGRSGAIFRRPGLFGSDSHAGEAGRSAKRNRPKLDPIQSGASGGSRVGWHCFGQAGCDLVFHVERDLVSGCHSFPVDDSADFVPEKTGESVMESMREGIDFLRKREGMGSSGGAGVLRDVVVISADHVSSRDGARRFSRRFKHIHSVSLLIGRGIGCGSTCCGAGQAHAGQAQAIATRDGSSRSIDCGLWAYRKICY